jgi:hypothetical protein
MWLDLSKWEGWYCAVLVAWSLSFQSWRDGTVGCTAGGQGCCAVLCYAVGIGFQQTWVKTRVAYIRSRWEGCLHV